ncbi:MAG: molybdopterin-dependent oxidoreductase [Thermomicrobium sp.]|nr:molybdopterin-dependent oxidoreductase [Thermomicrobium sp.]
MRRRDFLKVAATSATGAVLFAGCGRIGDGVPETEFKIAQPVHTPNDWVYGRDAWFATAAPPEQGGYGLIVRVFEGRAKKVDGNPDFPGVLGKSDARAQALVQELYHPDRITGPQRASTRGGQVQSISWDDALQEVVGILREAGGERAVLITGRPSSSQAAIIAAFRQATGIRHAILEPDEFVALRTAMRRLFGTSMLPIPDLANAAFLLNFSAEFLHGWIAPVALARAYGAFRQGHSGHRGLYYHVGPRLSATAANADRWFPIVPGSEGLVALGIANVLLTEGKLPAERFQPYLAALGLDAARLTSDYTPERVAEASGLGAEQIRELAHALIEHQPAVVIAGTNAAATTNGLFNLVAAFGLNLVLGTVDQPGGLLLNPEPVLPELRVPDDAILNQQQWAQLVEQIRSGSVSTVLVHRANPVYSLPATLGVADALRAAQHVVSFSPFFDETTLLADLVLPDLVWLEQWGLQVPDPGPGYAAVAIQQPVVQPFADGRAFGDVLIQLAQQLGKPLPWASQEEATKTLALGLRQVSGGNIRAGNDSEFLVTLQAQGGWWSEGTRGQAGTPATAIVQPRDPEFAGDAGQYPLLLLPYPSPAIGYGEFAHLPWLQALPEPISTNVWQTWIEVGQRTADELGLTTGDVVRVSTPQGTVELPVYVNPAGQPGIVAIPFGQGHTAFGRYAEGRGLNPLAIVAPQSDPDAGTLAWCATRCRLEKTGRRTRLARFEGMVPAFQLEEFPIVRVMPPSA